jgi:streptogramin lyase
VAHGAIDSTGDMWITSEGGYTIARITPTGTVAFPTLTVSMQPEFPAIDASNNAWIPGYESNSVYFVSSTGTLSTFTSANTGAAIVYPFGAAVDGNGNVWITNRCGPANTCGNVANTSTLVELNGGVVTPGTAHMAISPGTNYVPEIEYNGATTNSQILTDPLNLAIDSSGNIWITNYVGGSGANSALVEVIGAAAPVTTPLSLAAGTTSLGVQP